MILSEDEETRALFIDWKRFDLSLEEGRQFYQRMMETITKKHHDRMIVDASISRGRIPEVLFDFAARKMAPAMKEAGMKYVGVIVPIDVSGQGEMERWNACFMNHLSVGCFFIHSDARDWLKTVDSEN